MNERFELFAPVSPRDCITRLSAAIEAREAKFTTRPFDIFVGDLIRGTAADDQLRLWHSRGLRDVATYFSGTLRPSGDGTLISGYFHLGTGHRVFGAVFRLFACLLGFIPTALVLYAALYGRTSGWPVVVSVPARFLTGAFCLIYFSQRILRGRPQVLIAFLRSSLDLENPTMTPNHAMQLTASARHAGCCLPADPPAAGAPRSGGS